MIKTGLYKLQHLKKRDKTLFRRAPKNVSITLYDQILNQPGADEFAERILLLFSDERGAYKRTYHKRFEAFDRQSIEILKEIFINSEHLSFHDVSISDGRTAVDFFEKIAVEFPHIHYFASDYNPSVYVLEKGTMKVTLSHTGKILEIVFPPFVFNTIKPDRFLCYPLNHFIRLFVKYCLVLPLIKKYQQDIIKAKVLLLFSPKALELASRDDRFQLGQHDLLEPFKKPVHIIRAMNILNPSYFSKNEFSIVINRLYQGIEDGGLLMTGSNQEADSLVHGGLYQKNGHTFKKLLQSGNGSPVEHLILGFKA
jgi:hypothetical protein